MPEAGSINAIWELKPAGIQSITYCSSGPLCQRIGLSETLRGVFKGDSLFIGVGGHEPYK